MSRVLACRVLMCRPRTAFSAPAERDFVPSLFWTGEVVGILQRTGAEVVASLSEGDEKALAARGESDRQEAVVCVPLDRRLPRMRLRSRRLSSLVGQRFVLRVDAWPAGSQLPSAHLQRVLGPLNDLRSVEYAGEPDAWHLVAELCSPVLASIGR